MSEQADLILNAFSIACPLLAAIAMVLEYWRPWVRRPQPKEVWVSRYDKDDRRSILRVYKNQVEHGIATGSIPAHVNVCHDPVRSFIRRYKRAA